MQTRDGAYSTGRRYDTSPPNGCCKAPDGALGEPPRNQELRKTARLRPASLRPALPRPPAPRGPPAVSSSVPKPCGFGTPRVRLARSENQWVKEARQDGAFYTLGSAVVARSSLLVSLRIRGASGRGGSTFRQLGEKGQATLTPSFELCFDSRAKTASVRRTRPGPPGLNWRVVFRARRATSRSKLTGDSFYFSKV